MKNIELNAKLAKKLYGVNAEFDELLEKNFYKYELEDSKYPKSWNQLGYIDGFYYDTNTNDISSIDDCQTKDNSAEDVFATKRQVKSMIAYAKLTQLMKSYNEGWIPDWNDGSQEKYVIDRLKDNLEPGCYLKYYCFLAFPTEELRDEFLKNFEELIKTFYQMD